MKTAVSIPDDVFEGAECLARRTKKSRSQIFSDAVREYLARHAPDEVTDAVNRVCDDLGSTRPGDTRLDDTMEGRFVSAAARRILERTQW
jgi:hypothetical protein